MSELVYIVDDELHIRTLLEYGLSDYGFVTRAFPDGNAFLAAVKLMRPDAIILDWMMPPPDGMALTQILRDNARTRAIPILMLTARAHENDRVNGLECGADDYLTKPFSLKELSARLRSLLRRETYLKEYHGDTLICGDLEMDEQARTVYFNGEPLKLTMREFDLLCALMKNTGKVLTREFLLDTIWGMTYIGDTRTVDVHIRYIRKKLGEYGAHIETVRGVGYRFRNDDRGE